MVKNENSLINFYDFSKIIKSQNTSGNNISKLL